MTTNASASPTVHVLWTGGWDSTYRLLWLIHNTTHRIQPHYYIATRRPTVTKEVETIGKLRHRISQRYADAAQRLLPTRIYSVHEIPRDPEVHAHIEQLRLTHHIGTQYETLINLARCSQSAPLELSLQKSERRGGLFGLIRESAVRHTARNGMSTYRLLDDPINPHATVFSAFTYPLLDISKTDMIEACKAMGNLDIMNATWFCHDPIGGRPCGLCAPCDYVMTDGMGYRLPRIARFRYRARWMYRLLPRNRQRRF